MVSSHLLNEIELIANRMLIIHKGKKIAEGSVSELLDPSNTLVQLQTTDDTSTLEKLKNTGWASRTNYGKGHIQLSINKNEIPLLVTKLTEMNVGIIAINPRHSLEDYFLSLTNNETDV
jgi:ABC-type multidrug transport system ATPase subunit